MARKKKVTEEPVKAVTDSRTAVINFGDRTVTLRLTDSNIMGKVTIKSSGENFFFSSELL